MKSKIIAYLLWFFLGFLGIHKFYLHKWVWGILYLISLVVGGIAFLTGIVFLAPIVAITGIGWFVDLFILGTQVDNYNLKKSVNKISRDTADLATETANYAQNAVSFNSGNNVIQASQPNDKVEKLRNIKSLLDSGVLTQEEFETEKQKILNS
ncbi:MAG: NINE protein [Bacteroidales bacterium]|nr:NINE protein [Bacteroidales bacterium]